MQPESQQAEVSMQEDLLERSFEAATAKYKRMIGVDQQPSEASSQVDDMLLNKQPNPTDSADLPRQLPAAVQQRAFRITYTKSELTDIAELCTAAPVNTDILPSLQALHLETSPPEMHRTTSHQHNGSRTHSGETNAGIANKSQGSASQQPTTYPDRQPECVATEQPQQTQQQYQDQQYSDADWAAYWEYYGHTAMPPPPPPPLQLCSKHMQLLEQLSASQETTEPQHGSTQPASVQPAVLDIPDDTRSTLQARAQQVQGGNLTSLLMAWFEAGYQTGRHEALLQK